MCPKLTRKKQFKRAIGDKGRGLCAIGAALLINQILGSARKENEPEEEYIRRIATEKVEFVSSIMGNATNNYLSFKKQRKLIVELKQLQRVYIEILNKVMDAEDRLMLAKKAEEVASELGLRR